MTHNEILHNQIMDAIRWEPVLRATKIIVDVKDGIVTLTGHVSSYPQKLEVEQVVKRMAGVKAIIEKIDIKHEDGWKELDDEDIATAVLQTLEWNWKIPKEKIKVKVEDGWVYLEGELLWNYQKLEAVQAILRIEGIKGVTNNIVLHSREQDTIEKKSIEQQIQQSWALQSCHVDVNVIGTNVSLIGTVGSIYQKEEAGRIAWNTPGIWSMENKLIIKPSYKMAF
jgi:osmotically-inducible protein OsmY